MWRLLPAWFGKLYLNRTQKFSLAYFLAHFISVSIFPLYLPINAFFERILVMEKDQDLRKNRLRLMAEVRESFMAVADYSKIVIRGEGSFANLG